LAQWFKQRFQGRGGYYSQLIDRKNLTGLASKTTWSKTTYFKEYQESFKNGEYSLNESVYTRFGQTIRSYFSGGIKLAAASPANNAFPADTIPFDNKNLSSMEYNGNMGAIRTGIAIASLSSATTFGSSPLTDDLKEKLSAIYNSRSTFLIQEGKVIPDTISERFRPKFPKVYSLITNAKITDNDIVLDPFAGTGGVGLLIATICNPKKLILTDISYGMPANGIEFAIQNNIEAWTESIRGIMPSSLKKEGKSIDLEYRRDDALKLSSFNDGSVTKIISDPPRGEGINARMNINKQDAYNLFVDSLNSAARVLREGGEAFYIIPQEWCRYLNKDERVNKPYFKMDIISEFFEGERTTLIKFKKSSSPTQSSSPIVEKSESTNLVGGDKPGGIDFRSLPIVNQAISNLKAFNGDILSLNLNSEWQDIERLIQSGITPSGERIKEYLQVSCHQEKIMRDKEKMIICISNILRQQEERYIPTEPVLRDILIVLESTRSEGELRTIFLGTKP
jgi:tRNA1(Val) A37 N6-methylase TrmN6